jgi:hypothetical protein
MQKLNLIISVLFLYSSSFTQDNISIHKYDIDVKYASASEYLDIELTCYFTAAAEKSSQLFIFSSETEIEKIELNNKGEVTPAQYEYTGSDSLLITTAEKFIIGEEYLFKFTYSFPAGKFNDTLLFVDRGHRWYPLIMDQLSKFRISADVTSDCSVISAGNKISTVEHNGIVRYTWESRLPVFKIPLIVFNPDVFKVFTREKVQLYYYNADSAEAFSAAERVNRFVKYYSDNIGEFPYELLTLFEISGLMGVNTCSGLLMADTQFIKAVIKGYEEMLMLTTAQQWFGAGVYAEYGKPGFLFLNISLPHYLRLMFIRYEKGEEKYNEALNNMLKKYKEIGIDSSEVPLKDIISSVPYNKTRSTLLYTKGPYVLSIIEKSMGSSEWMNFLRSLYSEYRGNIMTLEDFTKELNNNDIERLFYRLISEKQ